MILLKPIQPSAVPAIHAVPKHPADCDLAALYVDTKHILQMPRMGVVTTAFAHYHTVFTTP